MSDAPDLEGDAGPREGTPVAGRYALRRELGRGGLAVVYRAFDSLRGDEVALKRLAIDPSHRLFEQEAAAFEREYHTLVQLSHPHIVEVHDFVNADGARYYTMELLDGGDLREAVPLPWREACALGYDVCSALALLHSRRLVHRDISPRNVRSTPDGAKLIDFGALAPMGTSSNLIGTPSFVSPEVVHRSGLDGRTDLFSLGATLYYALTGHAAYPARTFADLHDSWRVRPPAPSAIAPEIPAALDSLVLSLISLDPSARPRSAFEVMQHLASIASLERVEDAQVSQAYLCAPVLVGREATLESLRRGIGEARSGSGRGMLIEGRAGMGRSRMLDACALEAKIAAVPVLRVNAASAGGESLWLARALAELLLSTLPSIAHACAEEEGIADLLDATGTEDDAGTNATTVLAPLPSEERARAEYHDGLTRWFLRVVAEQPLVVLVDDLHRADPASLALLATLALSARNAKLLLVSTVECDGTVEVGEGFAVLRRECDALELGALTLEQTEQLVLSLFGDVPNAGLLADRLQQVGLGVPGEIMALVQGLVSRQTIQYRDGRWVLPAHLSPAELPSSALDGCREIARQLSPVTSLLAQVHALASHPALTRNDYALAAPDVSAAELDGAISELLSRGVVTGDGRSYTLARREWARALLEGLDEAARRERHARIAVLYAHDQALAVERVDHLLRSGAELEALDLLSVLLGSVVGDSRGLLSLSNMRIEQLASILDRALTSAERRARRPRELNSLRRAMMAVSVVSDEAYYQRVAPAVLSQLEQDSGLAQYRSLTDIEDPGERLMRALTLASERHTATPEDDRVHDPQEAIRGIAYYVVVSIAVGSRMQDGGLIASLPPLLEPFAKLSPLLNAIWQNSIATRESLCDNRVEHARARWQQVLQDLSQVSSAELSYVAALRNAVIYGVGLLEARLGMPTAAKTASQLDDDPMQVVSAMALRKIARLHQGDFAGAERFRKLGEQRALRANLRSMFSSTLPAELVAYALASDLTGIEQVSRAMEPMVARFPGWAGHKHLADGYFEHTRGNYEAALAAFERGLEVSDPVTRQSGRACNSWPRLQGAAIETLVRLDRATDAKERGERALSLCDEHGIDASAFIIRRALALAEAKLGDYAAASRRLAGVIDDLEALGVTGLELGATYEARARIAIWSSDKEAIARYAQLTAKEYRYGDGSALGARYERLMDEARGTGVAALPQLVDFRTRATMLQTRVETPQSRLDESMAGATSSEERTERALRLLCEHKAARSGHLYLRTERGIERVASVGEGQADAELDELARRVLEEAVQRAEELDGDETMFTEPHAEEPLEPTTAAHGWTDAAGTLHVPLLLTAEIDGASVYAGAALIEASASSTDIHLADPLTDSIAAYLLRTGDATAAA